jgi:lycopene cyclase domain-containing protein
MSYVLLDLVFLGGALLVTFTAVLVRRRQLSRQNVWAVCVALVVVLLLSAVFDNVMIGVGLVAYDPARISGLKIGLAPIEDFAYPVAVALLLPALWTLFPARRAPGRAPGGRRQRGGSAPGAGADTGTDPGTVTSTNTGIGTGGTHTSTGANNSTSTSTRSSGGNR